MKARERVARRFIAKKSPVRVTARIDPGSKLSGEIRLMVSLDIPDDNPVPYRNRGTFGGEPEPLSDLGVKMRDEAKRDILRAYKKYMAHFLRYLKDRGLTMKHHPNSAGILSSEEYLNPYKQIVYKDATFFKVKPFPQKTEEDEEDVEEALRYAAKKATVKPYNMKRIPRMRSFPEPAVEYYFGREM